MQLSGQTEINQEPLASIDTKWQEWMLPKQDSSKDQIVLETPSLYTSEFFTAKVKQTFVYGIVLGYLVYLL